MRGKVASGRFLSVYTFIFGFTKVQLTGLREHHRMVTDDQILLAMLHEMLKPCSHVE